MSRNRLAISLLALLALSAPLAGCGGGTDIDYTKAAETVRASLESKREGFGVPVDKVECQSGVKVEPGTQFECRVEYPDGKVAYALMKIRDAEGDLTFESLSAQPPLQ